MLTVKQLQSHLFLDIETVPGKKRFEELSEEMAGLWQEKAKFFQQEELPAESYERRAGIYAEFGKIICIGIGYFLKRAKAEKTFVVKTFYGHDEQALLLNFATAIQSLTARGETILCGHNIREFDVPYLCRRMIIHGIPLPEIMQLGGKKPWEVHMADTMQLWRFGDYKHYTSLKLLAGIMNIPSPKDGIDGSDVARVYWQEDGLERIAVYCKKDVITTVRVMQKMNVQPILEDENILDL